MVKLKELIAFSRDGEWGKAEPFAGSVEMRVIRGTDYEAARRGEVTGLPIRHVAGKQAATKRLRADDIVIETAGGTPERPTGRTLLVRDSWLSSSELPCICASFSRSIRIDPERAYGPFVYWALDHAYRTDQLRPFHTQHTGVARFQWTTCSERFDIELPERRTQRRVAEVLGCFDELIENNRRRVEILEEAARTLHREWIARSGGQTDVRLEDVEPLVLGSFCESVSESVDPTSIDPETPAVGLEHLPRRSTTLVEWGRAGELGSRKLRFDVGDVLFGKIRPYFHKVALAPIAGVCSTDVIVLRATDPRLVGLVLGVASSDDFVQQAVQTSNGTKMPRANWGVLSRYPVRSLVDEEMLTLSESVMALAETAVKHASSNRTLAEARDTLLPRILTGRVDVDSLGVDDVFGWTELAEASMQGC